jgi:hypothetical protein
MSKSLILRIYDMGVMGVMVARVRFPVGSPLAGFVLPLTIELLLVINVRWAQCDPPV